MNKQEVILLAQLLNAMSDAVDKLDKSYHAKKVEDVERTKKEILELQKKIKGLIK